MSTRRAMAVTVRILRQFRHDHLTLALVFVAPIVILSLLYFLMRGGSVKPAVDVVKLDPGPLGQAVATELGRGPVTANLVSLEEARNDLEAGRIAAYVLLPSSFSIDAASGRIAPELHLEGTEPSLNQPVMLALNQALVKGASTLAARSGVRLPEVAVQTSYRYGGRGLDSLDYFGAGFVGLIVFFLVFVITIVSFLRERSQGTLERLMASPLRRSEIVVGYMSGFAVLGVVQAIEVLLFTLYVLKVHNAGNVLLIFAMTVLMTIGAVNLGIMLSMFARTEFQAVQFIPIALVPQMLLSGIIFPISTEPGWLQVVSRVLPLTYAVSGLRDIMLKGADLGWGSLQLDVAVVAGFALVLVVGSAASLSRRVA
jgi:ABC-2 type transport system permease protein